MLGFIIVGFLAGVISGMGIGGGTILIPALTIFWGIDQKVAQITNLIYFVPTAIIALTAHIKSRNIKTDILIPIIIFGFIGAFFGSRVALSLDSHILRKTFGFFLLFMGVVEFFKKK